MLEPSQFLAAGGIAAAVAVGWSHIKTAFSYVSNFVLVNDSFDSNLTEIVQRKIRREWKVVPGGPSIYRGIFLSFREGRDKLVPFRLPPNRTMYRRGGVILIAKNSGSNLTITYLRGTVDVDQMVREAMLAYEAQTTSQNEQQSRFFIKSVTGREKGMFSGGHRGDGSEGDDPRPISGSQATLSANGSGYQESWLDSTIDKSFMYDSDNWIFDSTKDPFEHLYYNKEIETYIEQAKRWKRMEQWYVDRMIPWRRGWLLEGPGGTGKTSLSKAVAYALGMPIYQYNMSTLSSAELIREWDSMQTPCFALLEDFDTVFNKRESVTEHKSLSFDTVLNLISGINSRSGVFLIVSTNDMSKIDPALGVARGQHDGVSTRPGRIDTVIHVGMMDVDARFKMAKRILRDWPEHIEKIVLQNDGVTPVQFQETCIQFALHKMHEAEHAAATRETADVVELHAHRQVSS